MKPSIVALGWSKLARKVGSSTMPPHTPWSYPKRRKAPGLSARYFLARVRNNSLPAVKSRSRRKAKPSSWNFLMEPIVADVG